MIQDLERSMIKKQDIKEAMATEKDIRDELKYSVKQLVAKADYEK